MTADGPEWSEPTLVQVSEDEATAAVPEAEPFTEPEHVPFPEPQLLPESESESEPEPVADLEPDRDRQAEPAPEAVPDPGPMFTSVPVSSTPVSRRPRVNYRIGESPSWRQKLIERVADLAVATMPIPLRVLDVGCGDGQLLSELILRVPYAELYVGLDPRPDAVFEEVRSREPRLSVVRGAAEAIPLPDASFDLVLATLSLGLWLDQKAGIAELARVVSDNGKVIVVEAKKTQRSGRQRAHSVREISRLLESAGLEIERIENVHRSPVGVSLAHAFIAFP
jgi:SAM-dependent methyltransferase